MRSRLAAAGGKPYLWQDLILQRPSGDLIVARVDHFGRSHYLQLYRPLQRFAPSLRLIQDEMKLLVVVGSEHRHRLFHRLLHRPSLQRLVADVPNGMAGAVKLYRLRRAVPVIRSLTPKSQDLRELRAVHVTTEDLNDTPSQSRQAIHNDASHTDKDFWVENGGE